MVSRVIAPEGGLSHLFMAYQKPEAERIKIIYSPYSEDDIAGLIFAQAQDMRINTPSGIIVCPVVGQQSNCYLYPKNHPLGTEFSAYFHERKVVIRVYQSTDDVTKPIFGVHLVRDDNSWMTGLDSNGVGFRIENKFFNNMMQLKYYVSQASILTGGSAYQLFVNKDNVLLSDWLQKNVNRRSTTPIHLLRKQNLPQKFTDGMSVVETFTIKCEAYPTKEVVAVIDSNGGDTIDIRKFLNWKAVTSNKKTGAKLRSWVMP